MTKQTTVGVNIRRLRKAKGITPERLAVELGCTIQQVFNYEMGRTRITESVIRRVSVILGVDIEDLFKEVKP